MNEIKPGWQTSEFWLTAVASLIGVVVLSGAVPGLDQPTGDAAVDAISQIVQGAVALATIVGTIAAYAKSRAEVKAASEYAKGGPSVG